MKKFVILAIVSGLSLQAQAAGDTIEQLLAGYSAGGAGSFSAATGEKLWNEKHVDAKSGKQVNCTTCHGIDLTKAGSHNRTGKLIEPMSPKVNPERFTDAAKIEKWFLRNCKSTWGRECTPQEKGDILSFLRMQ